MRPEPSLESTGPRPIAAPAVVPEVPEQPSTMLRRFGLFGRLGDRFVFRHVRVRPEHIAHLRRLAEQGTIIYVMRFRSLLDYVLVNAILLREGLPLARFAPAVKTFWFRPFGEMLRWLFRSARGAAPGHAACMQLVAGGKPVLLFMRSQAVAGRRRRALAAARLGAQYLRDVLRGAQGAERPVFLVPIAIFRGKGFRRKESRFSTMLYSVQEAPGEAKRLFTYLWNADDTHLTIGDDLVLSRFLDECGRESEERITRRLARTLQIDLYQLERVVWGPALLPRRQIRELVLRDPELVRLVRRLSAERGVPRRKVQKEARGYFDEMAANFNGLYFSILEFVFNVIFPRFFSGLEVIGLDHVVERMKQHPVVLVPCHRSHFDYLFLTYIFHTNFLSPPHIAAGINLSFWPMGPLFRGAGAYFIRRTFDDNELYKTVFRKYLAFLTREGYTQEFFIEGGRQRTGKILTPKLGMLSAVVNSFIQGVRRDLYLVPISIYYGKVPEEEAYRREIAGEEKEPESLGGMLRAGRRLRSMLGGSAYVSFAEPISLASVLGEHRDRFLRGAGNPEIEEEKRRAVQRLGFRLLREVNAVAVAGATAVSATALLGAPHAACRVSDFLVNARTLTELLRFQGVHLTASLERNLSSNFRESLTWLEKSGLASRLTDSRGAAIHVPIEKRFNLDLYKNNTIHFFLLPSLLTRALLVDVPMSALREHVAWWLELYRWEFPLPERDLLNQSLARWLEYYREHGAVEAESAVPDHPLVASTRGLLENFREAYQVAAESLGAQEEWPIAQPALIRRMQAIYRTRLLLNEVHKPEGNSVITFGNALSRFAELGHIVRARGGRSGKELWVERGPAFERLPELVRQLTRS